MLRAAAMAPAGGKDHLVIMECIVMIYGAVELTCARPRSRSENPISPAAWKTRVPENASYQSATSHVTLYMLREQTAVSSSAEQ